MNIRTLRRLESNMAIRVIGARDFWLRVSCPSWLQAIKKKNCEYNGIHYNNGNNNNINNNKKK